MTKKSDLAERRERVGYDLIREDGSLDVQKLADDGPEAFVQAIIKDFQIQKLHPDSPYMHALFATYGLNLWMLAIGSLGQAKTITDLAKKGNCTNAEAFAKFVNGSTAPQNYIQYQRSTLDLLRRVAFDMTVAERMNSKHPEAEDRLSTHLHNFSGVPKLPDPEAQA
ncbi:MAG: hypothetical protein H8E31_11535 [Planctomycetes bacterium]|nr:hypothetical protein [Planctomycetota bacterium]